MTERWELVELIGQTLLDQSMDTIFTKDTSEAILDSVENLIRADERERTNTVGGHRQIRDEGRADMRDDLRAKVEALSRAPLSPLDWVLRADVLALLGGE